MNPEMKNVQFIITLEQMNSILRQIQDAPLKLGLPIVKIIESLPQFEMKKEEPKAEQPTEPKGVEHGEGESKS